MKQIQFRENIFKKMCTQMIEILSISYTSAQMIEIFSISYTSALYKNKIYIYRLRIRLQLNSLNTNY